MPLPLLGRSRTQSAEEDVEYLEDKIILGWDVSNDCPFIVDVKKTRHFLIVGLQGSGKSVALRRISDGYYQLGYFVDVLNDKHGEWEGVTKPNKNYSRMLSWQKRILRLPVKVFCPVQEEPFGWTNVVRYSPEMCYRNGTKPFSFRITDLSEADWRVLLAVSRRDYNRQIVWKAFYRHVHRERRKHPSLVVDEKFIRECVRSGVLSQYVMFESQKERLTDEAVEREIEALWEEYLSPDARVFEGEYPRSFIDMLYDEHGIRRNVIIDWYEFKEGLTWRAEEARDIYIALMLQSLFNWCKEKHTAGDKTPSVVVLDEAQKILIGSDDSRDRESYTRRFLKTVYAEGRKFRQHVVVACQGDLPKIPSLLYENTDIFLISPKNANRRSLNFLRESHPDVFEWSGDIANFQRLPQHFFLAIDKHNNELPYSVVLPYPNLSHITGSV